MRVLVTGGAGFVGSHVVDLLLAQNHDVVVVDNLHPAAHATPPEHVDQRAELVVTDLADPANGRDLERALTRVDAVCHQAARVGLGVDFADAPGYVADNDLGTAVLLRALFRTGFAGRFVLASSMVVYGEGGWRCPAHGTVRPGPRRAEDLAAGCFEPPCPECGGALDSVTVTEDQSPDPRNVYAATKLHQEHLAGSFARETGAQVISLRYHNVYGPRMPADTPYAGVASIFRSELAAGRPAQVFEDGHQRRDFVHVTDVARANLAALHAPATVDGPFNVASGEPHTVGEMATALAGAMGPDAPEPETTGDWRLGDVRHVVASPQRAADHLGFRAQVGFAEGMVEFATAELRAPVRGA